MASKDKGEIQQRRADVLDPEPVRSRLEQGMARRDELVTVEPDRVLAASAETRRDPQLDGGARLQRWAVEDEEAADRSRDDGLVACPELVRLLGAEHDRLLRGSAEIARDRSHDRPDEQVEKNEERDLQREQRLLGIEVCEH